MSKEMRFSPEQSQCQCSPVTEDTIRNLVIGDSNAIETIFENLRPRFYGYFLLRLPQEAEDWAQVAITKVIMNAYRFVDRGSEPLTKQFERWSFAIARNTYKTALRKIMSLQIVPAENYEDESVEDALDRLYQENEPEYKTGIEDDFIEDKETPQISIENLLESWMNDHMSEELRSIVMLRLQRKENREIVSLLHIPYYRLVGKVQQAREDIEKNFFQPAGVRPLSSFVNNAVQGLSENMLHHAQQRRRLTTVTIMGVAYTTQDFVNQYLSKKTAVSRREAAKDNLTPLSAVTTPTEYVILRRNENRYLVQDINGRWFIDPSDLEKFRQSRKASSNRYLDSRLLSQVPEGFVLLTEVAKTTNDVSKIKSAVAKSKIRAIRIGSRVFVNKEDITVQDERSG